MFSFCSYEDGGFRAKWPALKITVAGFDRYRYCSTSTFGVAWGRAVPTQTFGKIVQTEQEEGGSFGPDEIAVMTAAFDQIRRELKPRDRLTVEMIAKLVIALVRNGERDPERLRKRIIGKHRPEA
jgi:hypothetical protein